VSIWKALFDRQPKGTAAAASNRRQIEAAIEYAGHLWNALDKKYEPVLAAAELACIVCGHADRRTGFTLHRDTCIFGGGALERYECPSCDCIFGPKKYLDLPEAAVDADYRFLYSYYSEADSTPNEVRTFNSLKPQKGALYLDWGCGGVWSKTVSTLRKDGFDVWGYEPSAETSENYVVRFRGEISARFDGIFSNNVIEHFRDPVAVFRDFHGLLKEGGVMAHSSPCYEKNYTFTRFHSLFLIGRSPEILAERTGFSVIDRVQDGEYINVVFRRN
jgi:hypothetical protein